LNGIIFRDIDLLERLGLYKSIVKQEQLRALNKKEISHVYNAIGMRMIIDAFMDQKIKIVLPEYNLEAIINVNFAFIEPSFTYFNYEFVKVNFICKESLQSTKILVYHTSYNALMKLLTSKLIRFYINPSVNHLWSLSSQEFTI
jgi:hypothetical protein